MYNITCKEVLGSDFELNLFAISDLHLSFKSKKIMDIFGEEWTNHFEKIKFNWLNSIKKEDYILLCGDFSWAMNLNDAKPDLEWLDSLPGKKILIKGNHDFWWSGIKKLNSMYESISFIQNNHLSFKEYAICGSRGFNIEVCEGKDEVRHLKILEREKIRMRLSLDSAVKKGFKKIIYMIHYPPFTPNSEHKNKNIFLDILKEYNVDKVLYGHIHGNFENFYDRTFLNTNYYLTSCDYLNFKPLKIL